MKKTQKNVIVLGWVSFLTDVSTEMILPVLPLFLANVLGTSKAFIGLIEGIAESSSSLLKVGSGWYSDRIRRRKPLALCGYSLSNVAKPLLVLANAWSHVLAIRFVDRVGKGLRTAPRDALIAESSDRETRGRSFGIHRMMDTAGATVGAFIAFLFLSLMTGGYRTLFVLSAIPGMLAVVVLIVFVKERRKKDREDHDASSSKHTQSLSLPENFTFFLLCISFFTFSSVSYAFFILRANELGIDVQFIPLVYLLYNIIYAILAVPFGSLSDKIGRSTVLATGFLLQGMVLLGFGFAGLAFHAWLLFALYGVVMSITDTIPRALISDLVRPERRGSALGMYHTVVGIIPLPANLLFGFIWNRHGSQTTFGLWAVLSLIAFLFFIIHRRKFSLR